MTTVPPALGEGAAAAGYRYQYAASAALALEGLSDSSLEWVRIKDVAAGRVDDFIMGRMDRVDGYQFKHRAPPARFTFRNLTAEELEHTRGGADGDPAIGAPSRQAPLIRQLAEGWQFLSRDGGSRVVVHLVTNADSSQNDIVPTESGTSGPHHFTAFLREVWHPFRASAAGDQFSVAPRWVPAWEALRAASGLDEAAFASFVRDCELEFEVSARGELPTDATQAEIAVAGDIDRLRHHLFDVAALEPALVNIGRDDILGRLGWTGRFRPSNPHVFPVDGARYQPITSTEAELAAAVAGAMSGYVGLFGSPGSGKSTLLTEALRFRPERVVRYYAFVPDAPSLGRRRGEAVAFLHDVVLALHQAGFPGGGGTVGFDRMPLLERLHTQLRELQDDWRSTGRRTLLLVDGLDHAARDGAVDRSFLGDLPDPAAVPEGVLFVLGSQTDQPLPQAVWDHLRDPARRVAMRPLARGDVLHAIDGAALPRPLTAEQRERVAAASTGHPLALAYLLNALREAAEAVDVEAVLEGTPTFSGDIGDRYRAAWAHLEHHYDVVEALGYAARLRGAIDLDWLRGKLGPAPVRSLGHRFGHFFRREVGERRYFFHDSFRIFLLERTSETWAGEPDPARDAELHGQLADWLAEEPPGSPWAWDELYHRARAGQDDVVLERATQAFFRGQSLALRPAAAVRRDVVLALGAATRRRDPVAFARLVLAGAELGQREWHLGFVPLVRLLVDLGQPLAAADHLMDGWRLDASQADALEASTLLHDAGATTAAARLFDLGEPLDQLGGRRIQIETEDEARRVLAAWADAAPRFRPVEHIVELVRGLDIEASRWSLPSPEAAARDIQDGLLFHTGATLLHDRRWDDLSAVVDALGADHDSDHADGQRWWVWLLVRAWEASAEDGDITRARDFVGAVVDRYEIDELGPAERVAVASAVLRVLGDADLAQIWVAGVPQPIFDPTQVWSDAGFQPFAQRYRLNRLLAALGEGRPVAEAVPDPTDGGGWGMVRFERLVCTVASVEGAAWRGERWTPVAVRAALEPGLELFDRMLSYPAGTSWYWAKQARSGLLDQLVQAVALHGDGALDELRAAVERSWERAPWTREDHRAAIVALARAGAPTTWAAVALRSLDAQVQEGGLVVERLADRRQQIEAWLSLDDQHAARGALDRLLVETNAVAFRKDDQLAGWIGHWLPEANRLEPGSVAGRVRWFATALLVLEETTEDGADTSAALELLGATFRWSPRRAVRLLGWFLDRRLVPLEPAISELLVAALQADEPPIGLARSLVTEVVPLLADDGPSPTLLATILKAVAADAGGDVSEQVARTLAARAASRAHPASRKEWRRYLREALTAAGIDPLRAGQEVLGVEEPATPVAGAWSLRLRDGRELGADDVERQAGSLEDLLALAGQEGDGSSADWSTMVLRLAPEADDAAVAAAVAFFRDRWRGPTVLARLGQALLEAGRRTLGREVLRAVLNASDPTGWDRAWGGTRLDAARALVHLDRVAAEPAVYDQLLRDAAEESSRLGTYARNLHEILPALADPAPTLEVWREVEAFVWALFAAHELPTADLAWLDDEPELDSPADGLSDVVRLLLGFPALAIAQAAHRILADGIEAGDAAVLRVSTDALDAGSASQLTVLETLDAVSMDAAAALGPLREAVVPLGASGDFAVRSIARALCDRCGWQAAEASTIPRPAGYAIGTPPYVPDEILAIVPQLAALTRVADVDESALVRRTVAIMHELAQPDSWSAEADKRLGSLLLSARVHLPFRRPRGATARRAFFRVVTELVDSGVLDRDDTHELWQSMRFHDPWMVRLVPSMRPDRVEVMSEPEYGSDAEGGWLAGVVGACDRRACRLTESSAVLVAERSEFRHVGRMRAAEVRRVALGRAGAAFGSAGEQSGVSNLRGCSLADYAAVVPRVRPTPLAVENSPGYMAYDTPSPEWLALNPVVGRDLGWRLVDGVLPRWEGVDGSLMAWSEWWTDGTLESIWPAPTGVVGEGWLVLASAMAAGDLVDRYGPLRYDVKLTRSLDGWDDRPPSERSHRQLAAFDRG